ncbi:hypothetical protein [Bryobacter aggregatus]|uniref:hypothetical protein n=1 Tax=Bryobacter aggregatus TaxID=360054 RepID=UPI0004E10ED1|nr:hypothetical protein [Bryobacter aggregatus]
MPEEPFNYFNYFTEIEERFQVARGTGFFLLSPLDWALIESWKDAGIPLEAVLRGIDRAFEKWRAKKSKGQMVNSIAYCSQAVMEEAKRAATPRDAVATEAPFGDEELRQHLTGAAAKLPVGFEDVAESLRILAADVLHWLDKLEELEQRLASLEEKMVAIARSRQSEEKMLEARQQLEGQLKPYRGKMSAPELMLIERKFLDQRLLEETALPRFSLFYL